MRGLGEDLGQGLDQWDLLQGLGEDLGQGLESFPLLDSTLHDAPFEEAPVPSL